MDLTQVAGQLVFRRAQLELGEGKINASEIIGNLTVQNMQMEERITMIFNQIKTLNEQRNIKQAEVARFNGTETPTPGVIEDSVQKEGLQALMARAQALVQSNQALDEILNAQHEKANQPQPSAPEPTTQAPTSEAPAPTIEAPAPAPETV